MRCFIALAILLLFTAPAAAQEGTDAIRISRTVQAVGASALQAPDMRIAIWGIAPIDAAPWGLMARDLLDQKIGTSPVNCKIAGGAAPLVYARCMTAGNADLGLELLNSGLATVDRGTVAGTPFAEAYRAAELSARTGNKGVWRAVAAEEKMSRWPAGLLSLLPLLVPLALIAGPLAALIITLVMVRLWLNNARRLQHEESEKSRRREDELAARERSILVSALLGEIAENHNKAAAFLSIYRAMLADLQNPDETPKYQRVGDIVQKHPVMSKRVFESSMNKLSLLDLHLTGQLSKLYTALPDAREYINLDPDLPIEKAVEAVETVLKNAEHLMSELERMNAALNAAA